MPIHFRRAARIAAASACLLVGPALAAPDTEGVDEPAAGSGEALYRQYCAACHGLNATGNGPLAPILLEKPADLTRIAARRAGKFPTQEILRIVDGRELAAAHGPREMPVWGRRFGEALPPGTGAEAERTGTELLIVRYLESIQQPAK